MVQDRIRVGTTFSAPVQTGPRSHPAFCKTSTGSFLGVNRDRVVTQRVGRGIALLFHDHGTRRGCEWSATHPGRILHPGKTWYPCYRRLGGPQGRFGQGRKISSPPGFDLGPSGPKPIAIPTELPGPHLLYRLLKESNTLIYTLINLIE